MSKNKGMKEALRNHQPCAGGYGVELTCNCGATFNAAHQIEEVTAEWESDNEYH